MRLCATIVLDCELNHEFLKELLLAVFIRLRLFVQTVIIVLITTERLSGIVLVMDTILHTKGIAMLTYAPFSF